MLSFDRKQQNSVKQLSFNKKNKLEKKCKEEIREFFVISVKKPSVTPMANMIMMKFLCMLFFIIYSPPPFLDCALAAQSCFWLPNVLFL